MKNSLKVLVLVTALAAAGACSSLPRRTVESAVHDRRMFATLDGAALRLGEVRIGYADELKTFTYPLSDILRPLADRYGLSLPETGEVPGTAEACFELDVWLREESFSKGLDFRSSITGTFVLKDGKSGKRVCSLSYTEESEETIQSFSHLYGIFDSVFRHMFHESGAVHSGS